MNGIENRFNDRPVSLEMKRMQHTEILRKSSCNRVTMPSPVKNPRYTEIYAHKQMDRQADGWICRPVFGDLYKVPAMQMVHSREADVLLQEVVQREVEHLTVQTPVHVHIPSEPKVSA